FTRTRRRKTQGRGRSAMTRRGAGSRSVETPGLMAGMLAPRRLGGVVAALAFTAGLFALLASGKVDVQHVAVVETEAITWFEPPPGPPEPEPTPEKKKPIEQAMAAPAPASTAITLPPKKKEEESNAITLPPEPAVPKGFASLLGKMDCENPVERE